MIKTFQKPYMERQTKPLKKKQMNWNHKEALNESPMTKWHPKKFLSCNHTETLSETLNETVVKPWQIDNENLNKLSRKFKWNLKN